MLILALTASLVAVASPEVFHVETPQDLEAKCGTSRRIEACTTFVEYALSASCSPEGSLTASARFTPRVILMNKKAYRHELLHIADLRNAVEEHMRRLSDARYSSPQACRDAASLATLGFQDELARFAIESNERFHPFLRKSPPLR